MLDQPRKVWEAYERDGSFPYTGDLVAVYRPGAPAAYDPRRLVDAMLATGLASQ